ncbi:sensor domain-containing diguanylate cyclase [Vibrio sp.]|nr:sensor domain-containing diguanylate cyclase [Vibrio sp.]
MINRQKIQNWLTLRILIVALSLLAMAVTLSNSLYATYKVEKEVIFNSTLESNRVYASKLATMADMLIESAQKQLKLSASSVSNSLNDVPQIQKEINRLHQQSNIFNSVVFADADNVVKAIVPERLNLLGVKMTEPETLEPIKRRIPLISQPFISAADNHLVLISAPVFSSQGDYKGYVGGTIYLQKESILSKLLVHHDHQDGSYIYVVDKNKRLIYHPKASRIGEIVKNNEVINIVSAKQMGSQRVINSKGVDMLAGYAPVINAGWGIVAQRPVSAALSLLDHRMNMVVLFSIPMVAITLFLIWFISGAISRPLWQLAKEVSPETETKRAPLTKREMHPWYYEAIKLKESFSGSLDLMTQTINKLHKDSHSDPLTGLLNRRGMDKAIEYYTSNKLSASIVAIDIDNFKMINDTFGHDAGDQVIISLAELMQNKTRKDDLICRTGGDEFIIILNAVDITTAQMIAEKLRASIEHNPFETVERVTTSIGISLYNPTINTFDDALKLADQALYKAKSKGRNQISI